MKRNRRESAVLLAALCVAFATSPLGCTDFSDRVAPPVDCTVEDAYEIDGTEIGNFEESDNCSWFGVPDGTGAVDCSHPLAGEEITETAEDTIAAGGAAPTAEPISTGFCKGPRYSQANFACEPIPEGLRCGSERALHLTASRNNDWGGFFADYDIAQANDDVSEWDGIAVWARAEPGSERSVTLALDDKYTANVAGYPSFCVDEEAGATNNNTNTTGVSQSSGEVAGWVPSANACGNAYEYHLSVTNDWELYLIPFEDFLQEPLPNRRIEGFDQESLRGVAIRLPKDSIIDLWLDNFGFYREP